MNRSTSFEYACPRSLSEACSILLEAGSRAALLAGGTDLMVRFKRELRRFDVLVDLGQIEGLATIEERPRGLWIGAGATAADIARHSAVSHGFPIISQAASLVGGQQIRHAATLGGALAGGLRCQLRDQSSFWRSTIGRCSLDGGAACHAAPGARCHATVATDLAPALVAVGAIVEIHGPAGSRLTTAEALYTGDASVPVDLNAGELIVGALLPWRQRSPRVLGAYEKIRLRGAIDRPLVGVATCVAQDRDGLIEWVRVAACGNGPAVRCVPDLDAFIGARLDTSVTEAVGRLVSRWFVPTPALRIDVAWRRAVAGVAARRGLAKALEQRPHDHCRFGGSLAGHHWRT